MAIRAETVRAVLFDMDGVLVRTERVWHALLREASERFGGRAVEWEEFLPTFGQGIEADIRLFGFRCTRPQLEAFFSESFDRFIPRVEQNPDAAPALASLVSAGLRCAVVTNSTLRIAQLLLEAAGLRGFFSFLSCADQVEHPKPSPDVVLAALKQLGVPADAALVVGDSVYDRGAARAARVSFAGLKLDGDVRLERLTELPLLLQRA